MIRTLQAVTVAAALAAHAGVGLGQSNEQFIPAAFYWVGPYAAGGSGASAGMLDYLTLINERDGGVGGVKLVW